MERRREVVSALCEAFFPSLPDEAKVARTAGKESIALVLETGAQSVDFIVDEVDSLFRIADVTSGLPYVCMRLMSTREM
jgi:hypothetical protein